MLQTGRTQHFKSLRDSLCQMFKEGYVQEIALKHGFETVIVNCNCLLEMYKDRVYEIIIRLLHTTGEIRFPECGCIVGKGQTASCKQLQLFIMPSLLSINLLSCTETSLYCRLHQECVHEMQTCQIP